MGTAAVIDFGSFSSLSGAERVQSKFGSRIELNEFVNAGCDRCAAEFDGIVGKSPSLRTVLDQVRIVDPRAPRY